MKRFSLFCIMIVFIWLFKVDIVNTLAQEGECPWESPLYDQYGSIMNPPAGVKITIEQTVTNPRVEPVKNVIVYGQDEDEEGVSLTITINTLPGLIYHHEKEDHWVCKYFHTEQDDKTPCGKKGTYYYWAQEEYCNEWLPAVSVRRNITNVRVWLEPSDETEQWLRWTPVTDTNKASLYYMFPSRWMVGTWTPTGFVVTGTVDKTMSPEYYDTWMKQMKDYNFLAGDSQTLDELWSVTLDEVPNPDPYKINRVLGLFGTFTLAKIPYEVPTAPVGTEDAISYATIRANMNAGGKHWAASIPDSPNIVTSYPGAPIGGVPDVTIKLLHVPLDLPGIWYIGIMVEMERANFVYEGKYPRVVYEDADWKDPDWGDGYHKWFTGAEAGYSAESNYIYSYVLLTSPCNEWEQEGCWDNTY
jgi:hypothetical protein